MLVDVLCLLQQRLGLQLPSGQHEDEGTWLEQEHPYHVRGDGPRETDLPRLEHVDQAVRGEGLSQLKEVRPFLELGGATLDLQELLRAFEDVNVVEEGDELPAGKLPLQERDIRRFLPFLFGRLSLRRGCQSSPHKREKRRPFYEATRRTSTSIFGSS